MSNKIAIVGYEQEGHCEHCGRALKHCIRISDGRIVGATCFDKKMTLPKVYQGKKFRIGSENVIRYAKLAARYSPEGMAKYGVYPEHLIFDAA